MQATQSAGGKRSSKSEEGAAKPKLPSFIKLYEVASVTKTQAPAGADGSWYKYVLEGGRSPITGMRRGNLKEVTEHAKRCAMELNERNSGKSPSAWAPRRSANQ